MRGREEPTVTAALTDKLDVAEHLSLGNAASLLLLHAEWAGLLKHCNMIDRSITAPLG